MTVKELLNNIEQAKEDKLTLTKIVQAISKYNNRLTISELEDNVEMSEFLSMFLTRLNSDYVKPLEDYYTKLLDTDIQIN